MLDWYPLSFDSDGNPIDPNEVDGPDGIAPTLFNQPDNPVTDLWILSYGWNTSIPDGDVFYNTWVDLLRTEIQQANLQGYNPMFVGVFWPSKAFADPNIQPAPPPAPAAVLDERADFLQALHPAAPPALGEKADFIQAYRPIFDPDLKQDDATFGQDFGNIYDFIATSDITQQQEVSAFLATLKKYQQQDPHADQPVAQNVIDTGADALAGMLTASLNALFPAAIGNGLLDFLRIFSFWTMKGRAGTVGANGLAPFLASFRTTAAQNNTPLRIHLMGHSFGAKLLTAAVYSTASIQDVPQPVVDTMILFQGAFSQFSLTRNIPDHPDLTGFYVDVVEKGLVASPVTIIYSVRDLANNTLYPIGMEPVLEQFVPARPPIDLTQYHISSEFRGSIGANGAQGLDNAKMYLVKLPWPGIDQNTVNTVTCINVNRTPFLDPNLLNDPLVGIHNDYKEPEIFQAAFAISQLKRGNG